MNEESTYLRMLEESFAAWRDLNPDGTPQSRAAYLGEYIFGFTTYDEDMATEFGSKALEVCRAISDGETFEYIEDHDNYRWTLLMCNMPFFSRRLNWGASIRGAWWEADGTQLDTFGLWLDGKQLTQPMIFTTGQWEEFIAAMLAFANE